MDTPGFGDTDGADGQLVQEMMEVLANDLGSANTIVLAIDGQLARFGLGVQDMLRQMSSIFGRDFWNFLAIGVTKWKMDQDSITDRNNTCQWYPDQCRNEAWLIQEISSQLQEKFQQNRSFTFAFMDSYSQSRPDIDDPVQQEHWIQETNKLWQEATNKNETFDFLTIDDILEENFKCKQENDRLTDIIDEEISSLKDNITVLNNNVTVLSANVSQNADDIDSISSSIGEVIDQELSMIKDDINDLNKGVDHNADITAALAVEVTANTMHIRDFSDVITFVNTTLAGMVEENTCAIDELKTNGEENLNF